MKTYKNKTKLRQAVKKNVYQVFILCTFVRISVIMLKFVKVNVKVCEESVKIVNKICTKVISLIEVRSFCMQEKKHCFYFCHLQVLISAFMPNTFFQTFTLKFVY